MKLHGKMKLATGRPASIVSKSKKVIDQYGARVCWMNDRHLRRIVRRGIFALTWRSALQRRSEAKRDTGNSKTGPAPEVFAFLNSARVSKRPIEFRKRQTLFSQGEPANHVFYIQEGSIKVAVTSTAGKEAVVTILGPGDFLGEACLAGQPLPA